MTAAFLQTELTSLISDSKRKQNDVRAAAEKSLADLKAISVTSETQLAGDLLRNPYFIDPFILACNSKHAKLAATGTICLQRLVASRAIPRSRLSDLLDAFQEASNQGLDVQLKILQALPSLLQLYIADLHGHDLAKVLSLCASLAVSKTGMVSSTATATFQQLTASVLERQNDHLSPQQDPDSGVVTDDASKIFSDMCLVVMAEAPRFLTFQGVSQSLSLEVIETCLLSGSSKILQHHECLSACQDFLLPGMVQILEKSNNFHIFARCLRILNLLLIEELADLQIQLSEALRSVLGWLDGGSAALWKRVLCLELMRDVYSNFPLLVRLYTNFDAQDGQNDLVQDTLASLVRIAAEDPSLIGLGRQSTVPTNGVVDGANTESSPIDVQIIDAIGSVLQASSNVTGISTRWSTVSIPLLEQMDRKVPPEVPETYVYTLVLACVSSISDGLSRYIMPLSMPIRGSAKSAEIEAVDVPSDGPDRKISSRAQRYQQLSNPLKVLDGDYLEPVRICAGMVEKCWPAILAICSTFLNSALDANYYHTLVRTVQKLTQVSGVLELHTPRDALLTTLAKVSVPLNASSLISMLYGNKLAKLTAFDTDDTANGQTVRSPTTNTPHQGIDFMRQSLNIRNLLCLRALLNLGIALGSSLEEGSWFIIIQALQQVDALMSISPTAKSAVTGTSLQQPQNEDGQSSLASEIAAVGTASKRMLESTRTYSDPVFTGMIHALFKMIDGLTTIHSNAEQSHGVRKPSVPFPYLVRTHTSSRSVSGAFASSTVLKVEATFVLKMINDLAGSNLHRFASPRSKSCSWDLIVDKLLQVLTRGDIDPGLRLQASSIINAIAMDTVRLLQKQKTSAEFADGLHQMCLSVLLKEIGCLYRSRPEQTTVATTDVEIHRTVLEALENILSHTGDSLTQGWRIVFEILQVTIQPSAKEGTEHHDISEEIYEEALLRTALPAFRAVQMIVSDFLDSIDSESLWVLVQLLPLFGAQEHDVNISLTTASLFWNINRLIIERTESIDVSKSLSAQVASGNDHDPLEASENSSLWFATMVHLAELCGDRRSDVRNGALRVLLKIFEASGDQLTSEMWNLAIIKVLFPLLEKCSSSDENVNEWHSSYTHLLAGTVSLIGPRLQIIAKAQSVQDLWRGLVSVLESMLERKTLSGHRSVFTSTVDLLRAIAVLDSCSTTLLTQSLRLWIVFHPADLPPGDESSLDVFTLHAQILAEIDMCSKGNINELILEDGTLAEHIMRSTTRTLLSPKHDKYVNDVRKMSSDQAQVIRNLQILKHMMLEEKHNYTCYLLGLIKAGLIRHSVVKPSSKAETFLKDSSHQPKLIAFMLQLVQVLRIDIPHLAHGNQWLVDTAVPETLLIFNLVIATKYSEFPDNSAAPIWKAATTLVVEISEALKRNIDTLSSEDFQTLSQLIPSLAKAVLNAPGLEKSSTSQDRLLEDESFDVDNFTRLHAAFDSLLRHPDFAEAACKQYMLVLFGSSLIAKPWFGDFDTDLLNAPLTNLMDIRAGSIKKPDFFARRRISFTALDALFDSIKLLDKETALDDTTDTLVTKPARYATPYVILRIAHSIKTFLADQKLRHLNPPPKPLQRELGIILNKAITLRCQVQGFALLPGDVSMKNIHLYNDGKTHLRVLYPLILRLQTFWSRLPKLKLCAWQDSTEGKAIQKALTDWSSVLADDWTLKGKE